MGHKLLGANSRQWPLSGQLLVAAIGLAGATVAARLLGPHNYGEYFLGLTVVSLIGITVDLCVSQAILTRAPDHEVLWKSWRNLAVLIATVSALLALLLTIPFWESIEQSFMWILLCTGIPVTIASMVPRAFLVLHGQLRAIACIDVLSILVANSVMITLVYFYGNQAAAAAGQLIIAVIRLVALEICRGRVHIDVKPQKNLGFIESFRSLWRSAGGIYQSQFSGFLARNGDNLIVSIVLGPIHLAQYSRAYSFLIGPIQQAQMALTPMTLRDLTEVTARRRRLRESLKATKFLFALMLPAAGVMAACGQRLVLFLLGEGWEPASELMSTSAGLAISMTIALPARWILISDRSHRKLRIDSMLQFSILVGVLVGSVLWGIHGSMSLNAIIVGPLAAIASWMLLDVQFRRAFFTTVVPLVFTLIAIPALSVHLIGLVTPSDFIFFISSAAIAACTSVIALVLIRSKPRHS